MNNEFGAVSYPAEHEVTSEEKMMAMLAHLLAIFTSFIGPLVIWLVKKDQSPFVAKHAKEALAFSIGVIILMIAIMLVSIPLACIGIGFLTMLLAFPVSIAGLLYMILGAIRANEGKYFQYPFTSSFVK